MEDAREGALHQATEKVVHRLGRELDGKFEDRVTEWTAKLERVYVSVKEREGGKGKGERKGERERVSEREREREKRGT